MDDAAHKLLQGFSVSNSQELAELNRQCQLYERPVGVHDQSLRFFLSYDASWTVP